MSETLTENVTAEIKAIAESSVSLDDFQTRLKKLALRQAEQVAVSMFEKP